MGRFGPGIQNIFEAGGDLNIAVAGEVTVYSQSFELKNGTDFALAYKATSDGAVKLKIELEQGYQLPTTEGSADTSWVVPEGADTIEDALATETQHIRALSGTRAPVAMPYARLKITGLADPDGNAASTVLRAILGKLEDA